MTEYETCYLQHQPMLLRMAVSLLGIADAEDAVQDAALRVWRAWGGHDGRLSSSRALFRLSLRQVAVSRFRRARREQRSLLETDAAPCSTESQALARLELRRIVRQLRASRPGRRLLAIVSGDRKPTQTDYETISRVRRQLRRAAA